MAVVQMSRRTTLYEPDAISRGSPQDRTVPSDLRTTSSLQENALSPERFCTCRQEHALGLSISRDPAINASLATRRNNTRGSFCSRAPSETFASKDMAKLRPYNATKGFTEIELQQRDRWPLSRSVCRMREVQISRFLSLPQKR